MSKTIYMLKKITFKSGLVPFFKFPSSFFILTNFCYPKNLNIQQEFLQQKDEK
jgi:hypothetical protein